MKVILFNEAYVNGYLFYRSLKGRMVAQTFSFDQQFQAYQKDDFALVSLVGMFSHKKERVNVKSDRNVDTQGTTIPNLS